MEDQYKARSKTAVLICDVVIPLYTNAENEYRRAFRRTSVGSELGPSLYSHRRRDEYMAD